MKNQLTWPAGCLQKTRDKAAQEMLQSLHMSHELSSTEMNKTKHKLDHSQYILIMIIIIIIITTIIIINIIIIIIIIFINFYSPYGSNFRGTDGQGSPNT